MEKSIFVATLLIGLSLIISSMVFAEEYGASATVPPPIEVDPYMLKVMGDGKSIDNWSDKTEKFTMDFNTSEGHLKWYQFDNLSGAPFQAFLSDHFYSIDVGYVYGLGTAITQVTVDYNEGTKPMDQEHGLGYKTTATFVKKIILPDGTEKGEKIPGDLIGLEKVTLHGLEMGTGILLSDISPGWLRIYVGLVTKDPTDDVFGSSWPADFEVFSPGDVAGSYTGTLVISST